MKRDRTFSQQRLLKRNTMAQQVLVACLVMTGGLVAAPAMAQQASASATPPVQSLGDIVVTARKRDEKLLEVPISVLAYGEKELKASGTNDLYDLTKTAGFTFTTFSVSSAGRSNGSLVFRGLQGGTPLASENSGSLFIDGIFISSGQASVNTIDVARVEVLKGPQNAFFGRSTFGGAVNFVTKNPSDTFQGKVNATVNTKGSTDLDATLEGPLVENVLKGRITVLSHNKAAMFRASDGGDLGAEKTQAVSGTLYATPTDNLWIRARASYQQDDDSAAAYGFIPAGNSTSCVGKFYSGKDINGASISYTPGVSYFCDSVPTMDQVGSGVIDSNTVLPASLAATLASNAINVPFLSDAPKLDHMGFRRNATRLSLQAGYDLPYNAEWAFNIGYNKTGQTAAYDLDQSKVNNFADVQATLARDLTLDTRLSSDKSKSLRAVIGASYFNQTFQLSQADVLFAFGSTATSINTGNYANSKSQVPAAYGSLEYDILSNLTIAAETRYQKDKITATNFAGTQKISNESKNWLPRVSLKFKPNDDTTIYASGAKGVQPLQLNGGYTTATAAGKAYISSQVPGTTDFSPQPELISYELGIKQKLFNDRLQYSLTAYDSKWNDRLTFTNLFNSPACVAAGTQLTAACPLPLAGTGIYYNNDAKIKGIEFAADALITPNWVAGVSIDYKNAKWDKFYYSSLSSPTGVGKLGSNAFYFDGNELGKVPKLTASVNSTYRIPNLTANWSGYIRGDVYYTGEMWDSDLNHVKSDPYTRVNLRAGIESKSVTLEFFVKNLFNDNHWLYAYGSSDLTRVPLFSFDQRGITVQPGDEREFGMKISYSFD